MKILTYIYIFKKVQMITAHAGFWFTLYSLELHCKDWIGHMSFLGLFEFFWKNYLNKEQFQS